MIFDEKLGRMEELQVEKGPAWACGHSALHNSEPERMSRLYVLLYRIHFGFADWLLPPVSRFSPFAGRVLRRLHNAIQGRCLPEKQVWVRVRAGLSCGMWMRLLLPREARYWRGEHEPEVQNAISEVVRPGTVVYDIGAYLGVVALGAARLVGESGRIVAFDGDPENVTRLRENGLRNHIGERIEVVQAAVWSYTAKDGIPFRRGEKRTHGGVEAGGFHPVLAGTELINVPAISLDDFITAGGPAPQLIKIDVEGGEYEVLRGGARLFANQRPLIIAEVHDQRIAEQICSWLQEYHYRAEWNIPKEQFPRGMFAWPSECDRACSTTENAGL